MYGSFNPLQSAIRTGAIHVPQLTRRHGEPIETSKGPVLLCVVLPPSCLPVHSVKATFESYFGQPKGQRILIVGCGLSTIASQMHALGYRCITAIDISATAIAHMQAGDQNKEGVECKLFFIDDVYCARYNVS